MQQAGRAPAHRTHIPNRVTGLREELRALHRSFVAPVPIEGLRAQFGVLTNDLALNRIADIREMHGVPRRKPRSTGVAVRPCADLLPISADGLRRYAEAGAARLGNAAAAVADDRRASPRASGHRRTDAQPKWDGVKRLKVEAIRVHDPQPEFTLTRRWFRADRHLPVVGVTVTEPAA